MITTTPLLIPFLSPLHPLLLIVLQAHPSTPLHHQRNLPSLFHQPISTPIFGKCTSSTDSGNTPSNSSHQMFQTSGSTVIHSCAISPLSCPPNSTYLPPYHPAVLSLTSASSDPFTTTECHDPNAVSIGRCGSYLTVDDSLSYICAADAMSCADPSEYTFLHSIATATGSEVLDYEEENGCSLVSGSALGRQTERRARDSQVADTLTLYPRCRSLTSSQRSVDRCVISPSECRQEETFIPVQHSLAKSQEELQRAETPCTCQRVTTGLCWLNGSELTQDTTVCASGEYDCPSDYTYVPSYGLESLPSKNKPRLCTLCRDSDVRPSAVRNGRLVESGACLLDGKMLRCELEGSACNNTAQEFFQSSWEMRSVGLAPCRSEEMSGGECSGGRGSGTGSGGGTGTGGGNGDGSGRGPGGLGVCTNLPSSCPPGQTFTPRDTCRLRSDLERMVDEDITNRDLHQAWFGRCVSITTGQGDATAGDHRCVWRMEECTSTERYEPAKPHHGCRCEHVQTGVCLYDDIDAGEDGMGALGVSGYYCAVSEDGCGIGHQYIPSREVSVNDCRLCQIRSIQTIPPVELEDEDDEDKDGSDRFSHRTVMGDLLVLGIGGCIIVTSLATILFYRMNGRRNRLGRLASRQREQEELRQLQSVVVEHPAVEEMKPGTFT